MVPALVYKLPDPMKFITTIDLNVMNNLFKITYIIILAGAVSCTDLDLEPKNLTTADKVFEDPSQYRSFLAKLYAGLAVSGQQGPSGQGDIQGIDEGFSQYLRGYWKAQELPTDEAVTRWGDEGIRDFHDHNWTGSNQFTEAFYARIFFQIGLANQFLRETTDDKLSERGVGADLRADIQSFRAEARFLRALSYWHGLDLFRNIPFFTDADDLTTEPPEQADPQTVFDFIESELLAIENELPDPRSNEYGRVDRAAAWVLLSKLYLNAEVYLGEAKYTECLTFCNRVIDANAYELTPAYNHLFLADNHTSTEIIFTVPFDGEATRSFGGMTFLTHMPVGGSMDAEEFGIDGGWAGMRTTSALVDLFPDDSGTEDKRSGLFWTDGQTKEITEEGFLDFTNGIGVVKYRNVTSTGQRGVNAAHPDTDFAFFRLADVYLMYAESGLRGGTGGDLNTALNLVNRIRERAYEGTGGNITSGELTLDFILDERGRELYWECYRRTDLIRFNQFSENGLWPFKGGAPNGVTTDKFRDIYPIPSSELIANTKLQQNDGY